MIPPLPHISSIAQKVWNPRKLLTTVVQQQDNKIKGEKQRMEETEKELHELKEQLRKEQELCRQEKES